LTKLAVLSWAAINIRYTDAILKHRNCWLESSLFDLSGQIKLCIGLPAIILPCIARQTGDSQKDRIYFRGSNFIIFAIIDTSLWKDHILKPLPFGIVQQLPNIHQLRSPFQRYLQMLVKVRTILADIFQFLFNFCYLFLILRGKFLVYIFRYFTNSKSFFQGLHVLAYFR